MKDGVMTNMQIARKKVVELVQTEGIRVREKFGAIALWKWQALHPGSLDPHVAGFRMRQVRSTES